MKEPCPECGDPAGAEECAKRRAVFHREPWLPGGFELGAQWTSFDNGLTWLRCPTREQVQEYVERRGRMGKMTVTEIDQKTGTITIKVDT